jgi:adenylate kinase
VLLGPPAAGKGTQAEFLKSHFGFQAPSVGAMLREQKAAGTPAGLTAAGYFDRGLLVPDEIVIQVVRQWLAGQGGAWALDGFPRTLLQAEVFDAMLREQQAGADSAILIMADEAVIRDRVVRRLVCGICAGVFRAGFHVALSSDPCPRCGGALGRRADDTLDTLAGRLIEYRLKTEPVINHYEARGILRRIDGNNAPDVVFADFCAAIEGAQLS